MGFDRKEDFRSSFKEDRKPNEALKKCRKQGKEAHDRAPGSTAVLQCPGPPTAGHASWHGRVVPLLHATAFFPRLFIRFLGDFWGTLLAFLESST